MNHFPKVSVIVPVYNVEKYIDECLQSILNQTYSNIEIILVDDGSTDRSSEICDGYAAQDERIRIIHKKNGGLSSARNAGLRIVSGTYVTFVDSDDCIATRYVEILVKVILKYKVSIVYTQMNYSYRCSFSKDIAHFRTKVMSSTNALIYYYKQNLGNVCGGIFESSLFLGVEFPEGIIYEDNLVKTELFLRIERVAFLSNVMYFYRKRNNSIVSGKTSIKNLDILYIESEIYKLLKKYHVDWKVYKEFYTAMASSYYYILGNINLEDIQIWTRLNEFSMARIIKILIMGLLMNKGGINEFIQIVMSMFKAAFLKGIRTSNK